MVNGPSFMTIFFYFVLHSFVWLYDMGSGMTWGYDEKLWKRCTYCKGSLWGVSTETWSFDTIIRKADVMFSWNRKNILCQACLTFLFPKNKTKENLNREVAPILLWTWFFSTSYQNFSNIQNILLNEVCEKQLLCVVRKKYKYCVDMDLNLMDIDMQLKHYFSECCC